MAVKWVAFWVVKSVVPTAEKMAAMMVEMTAECSAVKRVEWMAEKMVAQ